jgi:hypothetical protein
MTLPSPPEGRAETRARLDINFNDRVEVTLTPAGKAMVQKFLDNLVVFIDGNEIDVSERRLSVDGPTEWHLWELFQYVGEHVGNGLPIPFVENRITLLGADAEQPRTPQPQALVALWRRRVSEPGMDRGAQYAFARSADELDAALAAGASPPVQQEHAALKAFCESTAAACRTEAQRCEVEAEVNRRDGLPRIAGMYTRIAESARERAATFDALAALAAGASQGTGEPPTREQIEAIQLPIWTSSVTYRSGFADAIDRVLALYAPAAEPEPSEGPR